MTDIQDHTSLLAQCLAVSWPPLPAAGRPLAPVLLDLNRLAMAPTSALLPAWLGSAEQERYASFRSPKRQLEWLGGRLAAKQAVLSLLPAAVPLNILTIAADPAGKPFLADHDGPPLHLSISHSGDYAAAVASPAPCGVDIQAVTDTIVRVKARFCRPAEELLLARALPALPEALRLTLLWTAKESIRKMVVAEPLVAFHDAVLQEIATVGNADLLLFSCSKICHNTPRPLRITTMHHGDYALALGTLTSPE